MMEDQNSFNNMHSESHTPVFIWIILIILLLSVVGFGTLYLYQIKKSGEVNKNLQSQIAPLQNEITKLQQEKTELNASLEEAQTPKETDELDPLFYSLEGVPATVTKEVVPFDFTAVGLKSLESDCGTTHPTNYFENLVSTFQGTNEIIYHFDFTGDAQGNHYKLIVLPNKTRYKTLGEFKNDFDTCAAGGRYAIRMNSKWLLLEDSCVDDNYDGVTKSKINCNELTNKIKQNLEFN